MDIKKLKKEYRKERRARKTQSYRFSFIGEILSFLGLLLVIAVIWLDQNTQVFQYPIQLVCYVIIIIIALAGITLDILGESEFKKEFKEYVKEKENKN